MVIDATTTQWISSRYQLVERIGAGSMGVVFRAADRLTGQMVALKQVTTPGEKLEFGSQGSSLDYRLALAQEFRTLSSLRHPNIISVLDYGFDAKRHPYYTMELLEGAESVIATGRNLPMDQRIELLVQSLQALAYLHRRNIIHRDLKPDNVVVVDGEVKVLDFGLAVARKYVPEESGVIGTLAYMAPEVLRSGPATETSDLYSLGIIAYELFAGEHPFGFTDIPRLIQGTLNEMPDFSILDVDERVIAVLMRMVLKNPMDRYQSAKDALQALATATNQPLMVETEMIRESYLQAAMFVGREEELGNLTNALYRIIPPRGIDPADAPPPSGSMWLVEGESGVGKSRLMEELRALALVSGALVLRGQAVEGGSVSYQIWRQTLRYLCLQTPLTDMEAGVLKPLVPDIDTLLNRPIPPPPDVDPQAGQERLFGVIQSVFLRQKQPIVLLLEDLHWADESLQVIKLLTRDMKRHALMIVGSYRNDEAPTLADDFLEAELITLERLSEEEIASLSESMLGPVGRQPDVVEFLERETEGNVFFIVEVVRALAEEAGQLEDIGRMTLPESVFARGMRAIIQHRLTRLPESAHLLLQVAAVGGRELDPFVLQVVPSEMDFDDWLFVCEMETVLEIVDNKWRFAHDKLREQLLDDLSDEARAALHEYYARAMEEVYPDDPAMTMILVHHWEMANNNEKLAYYTARAGEQAMEISAYDRAIQYLNRALNLVESRETEAELERLLAEAHYGLGNAEASLQHTRRALRLMNMFSAPTEAWRTNLKLWQQRLRQSTNKVLPFKTPSDNDSESKERLLSATLLHIQAAQSYIAIGDNQNALLSAFYAINLAEQVEASPELAYSYAVMAVTNEVLANRKLVLSYLNKVDSALQQIGHGDSQIQGLALHTATTAWLGLGEFERAKEYALDAMKIFDRIGDQRRWNEVCANLAFIAMQQGQFNDALIRYFDLLEVAQRRRMTRGAVWALAGMIQVSIRAGRLEETQTYLNEWSALIRDEDAESYLLTTASYGVLYHVRMGDLNAAKAQARAATREIENLSLRDPGDFNAYFNTLEAILLLRELEESSLLVDISADTLAMAEEFSRSFPFSQPRLLTWKALISWLEGDRSQAIKLWEQAIEGASSLRMPYDAALACYQFGVHLSPGDERRRLRLQQAIDLFKQVGAEWDLEQARQALG